MNYSRKISMLVMSLTIAICLMCVLCTMLVKIQWEVARIDRESLIMLPKLISSRLPKPEPLDYGCRMRGMLVHFNEMHYVLIDNGTCPMHPRHEVEVWLKPTHIRVTGEAAKGIFQ